MEEGKDVVRRGHVLRNESDAARNPEPTPSYTSREVRRREGKGPGPVPKGQL